MAIEADKQRAILKKKRMAEGIEWTLHTGDIIKCGWCKEQLLVPAHFADKNTVKAVNEQKLKALKKDTVVVECPCGVENLHPDKKKRKDKRSKLNGTVRNPITNINELAIEAQLDRTQSEKIEKIVAKDHNRCLRIGVIILFFVFMILCFIGLIICIPLSKD